MSFGWIDAAKFSIHTLLLMDRWIFRVIAENPNPELMNNLATVITGNEAVYWYIVNKCPEKKHYYDSLVKNVSGTFSKEQVREAEIKVLDELDWAVVYVYPEIMEKLPYIAEWKPDRLLSMADFEAKTVLDIGSGTGRLAFAAATVAKVVYASEPVDRLREYMREKISHENIGNVFVIDGTIQSIPFHDDFFDIVMSGHTFGDDYDSELREMTRVTKPGGYIIDCPGEDDRKRSDGPSQPLIELEFDYSHYSSKLGGDIYRYWKRV
ncbi:MAG: class I SAM-dependent methyltransferase [Dehalococcoidales bacterium]|nr:class I SAM-dependent methyltransferase [Dehalococcoidales bacterium]